MDGGSHKVQTSSYHSKMTEVNIAVWFIESCSLKTDPQASEHKEKKFFYNYMKKIKDIN